MTTTYFAFVRDRHWLTYINASKLDWFLEHVFMRTNLQRAPEYDVTMPRPLFRHECLPVTVDEWCARYEGVAA